MTSISLLIETDTASDIASTIDKILDISGLNRVRITSLYIENVELNSGNKLLDRLLELVKKGTEVTILIGQKPKRSHWRRFFEELENFGAKLYYNRRIHSKMLLLDCQAEKVVLMSSANYTYGGLHFRHEVGVCLKNLSLSKYNKLGAFFNYVLGSDETQVLKDVVR